MTPYYYSYLDQFILIKFKNLRNGFGKHLRKAENYIYVHKRYGVLYVCIYYNSVELNVYILTLIQIWLITRSFVHILLSRQLVVFKPGSKQ